MISTDTASAAIDRTVGRRALGTSGRADVCTVMADAARDKSVDYRTTAELQVSSFTGGHVWLRPAALDVTVPTTGPLAWRPPT